MKEVEGISRTELGLLRLIYLNKGIHVRALAKNLEIGIPSVKYGLNKLIAKKLVMFEREGRNLKFYINYNGCLIIPYLCSVEYSRFLGLPKNVRDAIFDFLKILKNKPFLVLIFGSHASGNYTRQSDLDVLLVFNRRKLREDFEKKAKVISERCGVRLEPVYLSLESFTKKFFDRADKFMKQVNENKILVSGMEWWVMLENEKA